MKDYSTKGRLGVCIEIKNNNYGSMLQSYATQVMLQNYRFDYDLILYKKKYTLPFVIKSIPRILNGVVWQDKLNENEKKRFIKTHPDVKASVNQRNAAFEKFRQDYFKAPIVTYYGYDELKKQSRKYIAFLTGSDQLWSPSGLPTNFYNLMFTYDDAVRISYASSFGVKEIPWYQKRRTKEYLERIPFVSCREQSGASIVKELTERSVPVVADPTMLFTAAEWESMVGGDRIIKSKYIFSYLLGTSERYREEVVRLSRETGLPIVSIHQYVEADLNFGDIDIEDAGPVEFVNLIKNAEYVCTDSFHGSVFSILYHTKFVVFDRYADTNSASKNTRIESLCTRLGLENRRFSGNIVDDVLPEINFCDVDERLMMIREESQVYLENAFNAI